MATTFIRARINCIVANEHIGTWIKIVHWKSYDKFIVNKYVYGNKKQKILSSEK